jgi:molecular chaperone DnaK (HSP70)
VIAEIARSQLSEEQNVKVVLTVPVHFGENKVQILKKAATEADFDVIQTIVEPAAALLAYDVAQVDVADSP